MEQNKMLVYRPKAHLTSYSAKALHPAVNQNSKEKRKPLAFKTDRLYAGP